MKSYHIKVQTFTFLPNALKIKKIIHGKFNFGQNLL